MSPADILALYRKDLAQRRQTLLEQFPRFLSHDQYLAKCGQFKQIEEDTDALNTLIKTANRANSETGDE